MARPFNPSAIVGGLEFKVTGRKYLQVSLRKYGEAVGKEMERIINGSLWNVTMKARNAAPVDTGLLASSIVMVPAKRTKSYNLIGSVDAKAPYSAWVEFGAGRGRSGKSRARRRVAYAHGGRKGTIGGAIAAGKLSKYKQPFLAPAMSQERPIFAERMIKVLLSEAQRIQNSRGGKTPV